MDTGGRTLRRAAPLLATALVLGGTARANQQIEQVPLEGADIPKYQDALPVFTGGQRVEARTQPRARTR